MKTLKELVIAAKCRKGKSTGITKRGAFWLACEEIRIRSFGGDGIGNSSSDLRNYLQLRHYRDGTVGAVVRCNAWHQGDGDSSSYRKVSDVLSCTTTEEVIAVLKRTNEWHENASVYSDTHEERLTKALAAMGLPASAPAPDDEIAK